MRKGTDLFSYKGAAAFSCLFRNPVLPSGKSLHMRKSDPY